MSTVPEEILLYNILPRLPSKSLVRFLSVCKSLNSFISNPSFIHLRALTHHNNPTHHFLFISPNPQAPVVGISPPHVFSTPFNPKPIPNDPTPPPATLLFTIPNLNFTETRVHSVKGLLCFHPSSDIWFTSHVKAFTVIANPTTRQVLTLPIDDTLKEEFCVSTHFGYDPVRDEFKVLRLVMYSGGSHEYKIFTIGCDTSWRVVVPETSFDLMDCLSTRYSSRRGLSVNGAIHWTYETVLLVFDVGTEQLRVMPIPSGYLDLQENYWLQYPDLVEIDGCLCLVGYRGNDLKLWILRDYKGQVWEEKIVVLPSEVVSKQGDFFPLCRVSTGEILLVPQYLTRRVRGICYDMDAMRSRSVVVLEMPQSLWPDKTPGEHDIFIYEESFKLLM